MRVTLAQISPRLNRTNLDEIVSIIKKFKASSDLIVFPELALSGYLLQDKLFEDAWELDELEILKELSRDIDIVVGLAMRDGEVFRNSALYFSRGEFLSQHNKVHLPNYGMFEEARYFEGGDVFESFIVPHTDFDMPNAKISMLICEDLWHKEVHKQLIELNPDFIIVLVASPSRGFNDNGLDIEDKWMDIIQRVSKECSAKLIFVNRVGFEDGLGFWGGSCILDSDSKIIHKMQKYKKLVNRYEI